MPSINLEQVLTCPNLPSLPAVAIEVLNLASKRNVDLNQIASAIQNDPALCVRILKTVNSSFYGLSKPCPTMTRALAYLGLNTVKSLVLGFSLVDWVGSGEEMDDLQDFWQRSVFCAAASRRIATMTGRCDPEEAFLASLMQDIGMLAMRRAIGAEYHHIVAKTRSDHSLLPELCRKAFGFDHAQVGSMLGERWRFSPDLVQAIREHHASADAMTSQSDLVKVVAISNHMVCALTGAARAKDLSRVIAMVRGFFDLPDHEIKAFIASLDDAHEIAKLLTVRLGTCPDSGVLLAKAEEARIQHQLEIEREAERLQQANSDLVRQTLNDSLTGVGNRKQFDSELRAGFAQAKSFKGCVALIMADADGFKLINDTYGHPVGDAVLMEMSARMKARMGDAGVLCRYGGEEFAAVLPGVDRQEAARLAEALRAAIADTAINLGRIGRPRDSVPVTMSLGVAVYDLTSAPRISTPELLVQAADKALYAAKFAGKNCVRVFTSKASAPAAPNA